VARLRLFTPAGLAWLGGFRRAVPKAEASAAMGAEAMRPVKEALGRSGMARRGWPDGSSGRFAAGRRLLEWPPSHQHPVGPRRRPPLLERHG
jgi:hypothetical protein